MPDETPKEVTEILARDDVKTAVAAMVAEEVSGLTAKRDELLSTVSDLKASVGAINDLGGIDVLKGIVADVNKAKSDAQAAALKTAEADGNIQVIKDAHTTQLKERDNVITTMKQDAITREQRIQLNQAIVKSKGIPEILEPVLAGRVRGKYNDDGSVSVEVLSATGVPMQNNDGADATIGDLIEELRENASFAGAFAGTGSSGMGSRGGEGGGASEPNPFDKADTENYNLTKQSEMYRTNPTKARALAAKAGTTLA